MCILQGHSSEGEHRNFGAAGFAESVQAGGSSARGVFLLEDWGEDGEGGLVGGGAGYVFWRVTGYCYHCISWQVFVGRSTRATLFTPRRANFLRRDIVGAEVNAAGGGGQGDVSAGVDQENSVQFSVLGSQFENDAHGFASQRFEFAGGEIFFAELDVVDAVACGFGDFVEKAEAAGVLVAGESGTVGDVVEEQALSFQLSV